MPNPFIDDIDVEKLRRPFKAEFRVTPEKVFENRSRYVHNPQAYRIEKVNLTPSKSFWEGTAFGRTLTGRNRTGRTVRKIGLGAAAIGGGLLGVDLGAVTSTGADLAALAGVLETVERIMLIIAAIIGMLAGGSDYAELKGERDDEREILEGEKSIFRRLKHTIKNTQL